MLQAFSPFVLTALLIVSLVTGQAGPPGDGEVRSSRDPATNNTVSTLTLLLKGPKGPLPVNMVITAVRKGGATSGGPAETRLDFHMPGFVGQLDISAPHLQLKMDAATKDERTASFSVDGNIPLAEATSVSIPVDLVALRDLAKATTVSGRLLGIEFVLTPQQVRAVTGFVATMK